MFSNAFKEMSCFPCFSIKKSNFNEQLPVAQAKEAGAELLPYPFPGTYVPSYTNV